MQNIAGETDFVEDNTLLLSGCLGFVQTKIG